VTNGRTIGVLALGLLCGLVLCACALADEPNLSEVRGFDNFPIYYAGASIGEIPLREVLGDPDQREETTWVFLYGRCEDPPADAGCAPPLQIHSYSGCVWARLGQPEADELFRFRGAKAKWAGADVLEILTGRTAVKISGHHDLVLKAGRLLRNVHQTQPRRLPAPAPGILSGKQTCHGEKDSRI
jgi:hypothetical protein